MAGPKEIEAKLRRVITSWENLAPTKSFGGMTLAQFKTQTAPSFTTRETIINVEGQLTQAKTSATMPTKRRWPSRNASSTVCWPIRPKGRTAR